MEKGPREFNNLKWRREINRRMRIIHRRIREMPKELDFATGKIERLPSGYRTPPLFALAAAKLGSVHMFKPLNKVTPKDGKSWTVGGLIEFGGIIQGMYSYVGAPTGELAEMEKDLPALEKLRRPLAKRLERAVRKYGAALDRFPEQKGPLPIALEVEALKIYQRGLTGMVTEDGEITGLKTMTSRIFNIVWVFWPELQDHSDAPSLQRWFRSTLGENMSDKTFEAAVTAIRKECAQLKCDPNSSA